MKDPKEIQLEAIEAIKTLKIENEVMSKIDGIVTLLSSKPMKDWPESRLIDAINELAVLMVNLGQDVTDAELYEDLVSNQRKSEFRKAYLKYKKSKVTDTTSKVQAEEDTQELTDEEDIAKHMANSLKRYHSDLDRMVSTTQSRIKLVAGDRVRSNM